MLCKWFVLCQTELVQIAHTQVGGNTMNTTTVGVFLTDGVNIHTQWVREEASCSTQEAIALTDIINSEWLIEKWSCATTREIRRAVKQAQAILADQNN